MDIIDEMMMEEEEPSYSIRDYVQLLFSPITMTLNFLSEYGWYVLGAAIVSVYLWNKLLQPWLKQWQEAREDAYYKKNPDVLLARMEAVQRARHRQQELLLAASQRAREEAALAAERKRAKAAELAASIQDGGGHRLGSNDEHDLPLSRGASGSSYRPPKRSKCGGGGCGK